MDAGGGHGGRKLPDVRRGFAACAAAADAENAVAAEGGGDAAVIATEVVGAGIFGDSRRQTLPAFLFFEKQNCFDDLAKAVVNSDYLGMVSNPACLVFLVVVILFSCTPTNAQAGSTSAAASSATPVKLEYPESASGLEHLVKDILKAQRENDGSRAEELLRSLVLPNPRPWYESTFGPVIAGNEGERYEKASSSVAPTLARHFLEALQFQADEIQAKKFDRSCDDDAGEDTFGILHARREATPLYEIRFLKGSKLMRIFAFAFVNGGFRFILTPNLEGKIFWPPLAKASKLDDSSGNRGAEEPVITNGVVQAARLIHRVQPDYPEIAKRERLEGTVVLHALIAKDGSVQQLYVLKGYCSLSQTAVDAVRKWRYSPTLLGGFPVDVDTQIKVIYQLAR